MRTITSCRPSSQIVVFSCLSTVTNISWDRPKPELGQALGLSGGYGTGLRSRSCSSFTLAEMPKSSGPLGVNRARRARAWRSKQEHNPKDPGKERLLVVFFECFLMVNGCKWSYVLFSGLGNNGTIPKRLIKWTKHTLKTHILGILGVCPI